MKVEPYLIKGEAYIDIQAENDLECGLLDVLSDGVEIVSSMYRDGFTRSIHIGKSNTSKNESGEK